MARQPFKQERSVYISCTASLTLQTPKLVHKHLHFSLGEQPDFGKAAPREAEFKSPGKQYGIRSHEFMSQHGTMQHPALRIAVYYSDDDHIRAEQLLMNFILIDGFYPPNTFNREKRAASLLLSKDGP